MNRIKHIIATLMAAPETGGVQGSVYFLGIGGIGMSALARYFHRKGISVSGYDKTETVLCRQLTDEGIAIHYEDNIERLDRHASLVVYTPAIPKDHTELNYYLSNGYPLVKRSEVLGAVTSGFFNICVAGTHGKTTTSSLVAHLLRHSGHGCNAFLGGIAVNYDSNFWSSDSDVAVAEADEYDRSFLQLTPDVAIISSMDPDHLDIYGTAENMEQAFIDFSKRIQPAGLLLSRYGLKRQGDLVANHRLTYGVDEPAADINASNIRVENGQYLFDLQVPGGCITGCRLNMGGRHNIENAAAAMAVARHLNISDDKIRAALADFRGVKRRFEYIFRSRHLLMVDDYAHHPEELRALIRGARELYGNMKCVVVFQPHLYSRTHDHADGFAAVLDGADETILLPIYPARELPMPGVSSAMILDRMRSENKMLLEKNQLGEHIRQELISKVEEGYEGTLLITAGAGDIDTLVAPLRQILEEVTKENHG